MSAEPHLASVVDYYATHPIHEAQILEHLRRRGIDPALVTQAQLREHDQDHFGGLPALDRLADLARIDARSRVLDVACGLGGPARHLADRFGCHVTGIDLTAARIASAVRLTERVGLADRVRFVHGSALAMPFADASFDVVIGEEAWVHVPGKAALIAEIVRVTAPGGRIAFTDILERHGMDDATRERLRRGMTFVDFATLELYPALLAAQGCTMLHVEDLSAEWTRILVDRLAMYRSLADTTASAHGQARAAEWDTVYADFVRQYELGVLGGGRFVALKP